MAFFPPLFCFIVNQQVFGNCSSEPPRLWITSALTACRAASSIFPHVTSPEVKGQRSDSHGWYLVRPPSVAPYTPPPSPWYLRADVSPTLTRRTEKKKKKSQRSNHLNIWMLLHAEHFPPSPTWPATPPPSVCSQWCLFYRWGHGSVSAPSRQQSSSNTHDSGFSLFKLSSSIRRGVSSSAQSGERCMPITYKLAFFFSRLL